MLKTLYEALKENEFDTRGRCKCCTGDSWHGHASWCKVGRAIAEFEAEGSGGHDLQEVSQVRKQVVLSGHRALDVRPLRGRAG